MYFDWNHFRRLHLRHELLEMAGKCSSHTLTSSVLDMAEFLFVMNHLLLDLTAEFQLWDSYGAWNHHLGREKEFDWRNLMSLNLTKSSWTVSMAIRIRRNPVLCSLWVAIRLRRGTWRMEWREFLWEKEESVELFFFLRVMDLFLVSSKSLTFIWKTLLFKSRRVILEIRKESESAIKLPRCVMISLEWQQC